MATKRPSLSMDGPDAEKSVSRSTASPVPAGPIAGTAPVLPVRGSDTNTLVQDADPEHNSNGTAHAASPVLKKRRHKRLHFALRDAGDSGRSGFHPFHFLRIAFRSSSKVSAGVNVLWPVVPAAIACRYSLDDSERSHLIIFILAYIAMVPCANMIGFAGQELARKVPHVLGVLTETTIGSIVEIVLFTILVTRGLYQVVQAAILGSILATMLLCLGLCFFVGGVRRDEQEFSETVSEAGNGLLLTAGFGLAIPTIFHDTQANGTLTDDQLTAKTVDISRVMAILLILAYAVFVFFQTQTHHGIYNDIFEADEERDHDQNKDANKAKLTMTEAIIALAVSVTLVTIIALSLVEEIEFIVEQRHVSDAFIGLILVPLVEKAAEHLTAIDEAWDNQMNFALSHVLGATLQTAMFNGPLAVIVGWGLHKPMSLDFETFDIAMLLLAIITVGNFLRDQKSNYLEGFLCIIVYIGIAVAAYNYPNPAGHSTTETETAETAAH